MEGAISAWRGVAALDPGSREARGALKRLLTTTERWDDLVDVLDREALSATDPEPKAEVYRQLAQIHRERRGDLEAAIFALRSLRELLPGDVAARDALCDALLEAGATIEAVPLLRQRVDTAGGAERAQLLRALATVLEEGVGDEEGAFEAWARLLDENPTDLDAISHMEAIDGRAGRHERLLSTLSYRVEVSPPEERAGVLAHMGRIAETALGDLDRAAELYARALELARGDAAILDALCQVYDRAERYRDLVVLLRETATAEPDAQRRAELYRRIARTLADRVGNDDGAAEAFREVLAAGEDEEALRFLRRHATRQGDAAALDDALARLSVLLAGTAEVQGSCSSGPSSWPSRWRGRPTPSSSCAAWSTSSRPITWWPSRGWPASASASAIERGSPTRSSASSRSSRTRSCASRSPGASPICTRRRSPTRRSPSTRSSRGRTRTPSIRSRSRGPCRCSRARAATRS
ncbi:MAG: hypothetical protein M5U28_56115 [Sandaracinaceae bacterium]|nr:hypothetical protein [Sandaracinaceae bacterium]